MLIRLLAGLLLIISACAPPTPTPTPEPTATPLPPNCFTATLEEFADYHDVFLRSVYDYERTMSFEDTRDMLADMMGPDAYSLEAEPLIREILIERQNRSYDDWLSLRWQGIQNGLIPCP